MLPTECWDRTSVHCSHLWICNFCSAVSLFCDRLFSVTDGMDLKIGAVPGEDSSSLMSHSSDGSSFQTTPFGRPPQSLTTVKSCEQCKQDFGTEDDYAPAESHVLVRCSKHKTNPKTGQKEPAGSECLACQVQNLKQFGQVFLLVYVGVLKTEKCLIQHSKLSRSWFIKKTTYYFIININQSSHI